jgi:hypothetical protein
MSECDTIIFFCQKEIRIRTVTAVAESVVENIKNRFAKPDDLREIKHKNLQRAAKEEDKAVFQGGTDKKQRQPRKRHHDEEQDDNLVFADIHILKLFSNQEITPPCRKDDLTRALKEAERQYEYWESEGL